MKANYKKRKFITVCSGALLWGVTCIVSSQNSIAQSVSQPFFIQNVRSGKCLDVKGSPGINDLTPLQLYTCEISTFRTTDQRWRFYYTGGRTFIQNIRSSKCLDVKGSPGINDLTPLQLYTCEFTTSNTDQTWAFLTSSFVPNIFLQNIRSGKCIDALGSPGINDLTPLQLYTCEVRNTSTDQTWKIVYYP